MSLWGALAAVARPVLRRSALFGAVLFRAALCCAVMVSGVASAGAQSAEGEGTQRLREAEEAYLAVNFAGVSQAADAAIEAGGLDQEQLARAYRLLGLGRAAAGDAQGAVQAYRSLLAIEPDARVDANLAPRLRSPFFEAQGYWAGRGERLALHCDRQGQSATVSVVDVLGLGARLVDEHGVVRDPAPELVVESSESLGFRVEDAHGNVLRRCSIAAAVSLELPTETPSLDAPSSESLAEPAATTGTPLEATPEPVEVQTRRRPWWPWVAAAAAVVVGGAIGLGVALRDPQVNLRSEVRFR